MRASQLAQASERGGSPIPASQQACEAGIREPTLSRLLVQGAEDYPPKVKQRSSVCTRTEGKTPPMKVANGQVTRHQPQLSQLGTGSSNNAT